MNRKLRLGTLTAALLLVTAAMSINPRPAHAICPCATDFFVTDCWGKGATCAQAVANLPSGCAMVADTACYDLGYDGSCQVSYVQNTPYYCWYDAGTGMWIVDARTTFKCRICVDIDPIDPRP